MADYFVFGGVAGKTALWEIVSPDLPVISIRIKYAIQRFRKSRFYCHVSLNFPIAPLCIVSVPCEVFLERQGRVVDALPNRIVILIIKFYALPNQVAVCVEYLGSVFCAIVRIVR